MVYVNLKGEFTVKAIQKKLLLASVAVGVLTPFLTGGTVVHAEYNPPSAASNNEVIVNNGNYSINGTSYNFTNPLTNTFGTIWGATAGATSFTNNIFTINDGTLQGSILGAVYSPDGFASYNTLNLNGGTFLEFGSFFGANANTLAQGNIINIGSGVTFPTDYFFIHGGYATTATENTINVNGDIDNSSAHIAAGNATDSAYSNVVNINSGTVNLSHIYGAFSNNLVSGNKLNINGGTVTIANDIAGGYINSDSGTAEGNEVNITAGNINVGGPIGRIFGGYGINSATKNSVNISGGNISNNAYIDFYGGYSSSGNATNNTVNINGGTFTDSEVFGGYAGKNATNNTVNLNGGMTSGDYRFAIIGGEAVGTASSNSVILNDGTFSELIGGGMENATSATSNNVIINGGTITNYGGSVLGGAGNNVTDNTVTINDGTINKDYNANHGFSSFSSGGNGVGGGYSFAGTVSNNTVTINGGTINSQIYGGTSYNGTVTDNTINIYNNPDLSNAWLYGYATYSGSGSGNALNIYTKNLTA